MQSLGEFGVDGYDDAKLSVFYWAIFLLSTLFLQITLLNLLIAIMGDTFDRVMEVAVESKSKEICSFVIEYYNLFPESKFIKNGMVVVA